MDHRGQMRGAVDDGRVHDLAGAGRAGVVEGGQEADDEIEGAARVVAEEVGGDGGRGVRGADHAEGAGQGDVRDVVVGALGERALLAPAGHPAVDECRVADVAGRGAHAEAFGDARPVALDQDVGAFGQVEDDAGAVRGLQVDDHRALVAVGDVVQGVHGQARAARPVDADDIGTEVGEEHGGERSRADAREFHHAHTGERAVPGRLRHCHRAPMLCDTHDVTPVMLRTCSTPHKPRMSKRLVIVPGVAVGVSPPSPGFRRRTQRASSSAMSFFGAITR